MLWGTSLKDRNWADLWINSLNFRRFVFIVCPSRGLLKYIETRFWTFTFTSYKAFWKNYKRSETSLPVLTFCIIFWCTKCYCLIAFSSWKIGQYVFCNYFFPSLWCHRVWISSSFLIKPFLWTKKYFYLKWKAFFIDFKRPSLKQIKPTFWEGGSSTLNMLGESSTKLAKFLYKIVQFSKGILVHVH